MANINTNLNLNTDNDSNFTLVTTKKGINIQGTSQSTPPARPNTFTNITSSQSQNRFQILPDVSGIFVVTPNGQTPYDLTDPFVDIANLPYQYEAAPAPPLTPQPTTVNIQSGAGLAPSLGALHMANNPRISTIDLGNVASTVTGGRTTTINGGDPIFNDTVNISNGNPSASEQTVNILSGVCSGGDQTLNLLNGNETGGNQVLNLLNGNETSGTQVVNLLSGNESGGNQTLNILNGDESAGSQELHIMSGNSSGSGTQLVNILSGNTVGNIGLLQLGAAANPVVVNIGNSAASSTTNILAGAPGLINVSQMVTPNSAVGGYTYSGVFTATNTGTTATLNGKVGTVSFTGVSLATSTPTGFTINNNLAGSAGIVSLSTNGTADLSFVVMNNNGATSSVQWTQNVGITVALENDGTVPTGTSSVYTLSFISFN